MKNCFPVIFLYYKVKIHKPVEEQEQQQVKNPSMLYANLDNFY